MTSWVRNGAPEKTRLQKLRLLIQNWKCRKELDGARADKDCAALVIGQKVNLGAVLLLPVPCRLNLYIPDLEPCVHEAKTLIQQ